MHFYEFYFCTMKRMDEVLCCEYRLFQKLNSFACPYLHLSCAVFTLTEQYLSYQLNQMKIPEEYGSRNIKFTN